MAKATMVFEDKEDGSVSVTATFDPPLEKGDRPTSAQRIVLSMCEEAGSMAGKALWGDE